MGMIKAPCVICEEVIEGQPAGIYLRISEDRSGDEEGVERQLEDCHKLVHALGLVTVEVFQDNDISAYSGKFRPRYQAMLKAIEHGQIDRVVAWHPKRIIRRMDDLGIYMDLCEKNNVETHCVTAGKWNLASASDKMVARILGSVAMNESEEKAERVSRARLQASEKGKFLGGRRPFGFEPDGKTIRESEAAELRDATQKIADGVGLRTIMSDWNDRGIKTVTGRTWQAVSLAQVVKRPRNAGHSFYKGEIRALNQWDAIVSDELWRAACATLSDPARKTSPGPLPRWLGSGLYVCPTCEMAEMRVSSHKGHAQYRCRSRQALGQKSDGLRHAARRADTLDKYVEFTLVRRLMTWKTRRSTPEEVDLRGLQAELEQLQEGLNQQAIDQMKGLITRDMMLAGVEYGERRKNEIKLLMRGAKATPMDFLPDDPEEAKAAWYGLGDHPGLTLGQKRDILNFHATVVLKLSEKGRNGAAFDLEDSVDFIWKR